MLLDRLGASLLGDLLSGKGMYRTGYGIYRAGYRLTHPLTNFEIIGYFKDETRFNSAYLRDKLPKLKNAPYIINLGHIKNTGTH